MDVDDQILQALRAGQLDRLQRPTIPLRRRQRAHLKTLTEMGDDRARWLGVRRLGPRSAEAPHLIRRGEAVESHGRQGLFVGVHPHSCRPILAEDDAQLAQLSAYFDQQYARRAAERLTFRLGWWTRQVLASLARALPIAVGGCGLGLYLWLAWPVHLLEIPEALLGGLGMAILVGLGGFVCLPLVMIPGLIVNIVFEIFALELEERWRLRQARLSGGE
ncbi:MAG: hypothetical protein AAFV53_20035 [Myxococcota bacterium]